MEDSYVSTKCVVNRLHGVWENLFYGRTVTTANGSPRHNINPADATKLKVRRNRWRVLCLVGITPHEA